MQKDDGNAREVPDDDKDICQTCEENSQATRQPHQRNHVRDGLNNYRTAEGKVGNVRTMLGVQGAMACRA